ncbi:hypothetical protein N0V84_005915 [Fusarium piperis]|uniref:NmrA-like domain-containing protein n=1 Tax=Fusarium piperis TaxID=1435070 RepID=A0A9W9BPT3_9HYPO|nr:hypothetical protein N0V84_005915 [Fusarium piperis]
MPFQGRKIAIVGGTGTVGSPTLSSLLDKNMHTITAISRNDSSATFPENVTVLKGDYSNEDFLVSALKGQDVLILQLSPRAMSVQESFIRAAAKAGVPYILPTEFGTDIEALELTREQPIISEKKGMRDLVEQLGVGSWIAVVNNLWFDWSLKMNCWGINIKERKAEIWNGGNVKANTSTIKRVGAAVAELLSCPEEELSAYKNKPFYISSFWISQREMLESVQRVTGTTDADWEIKERDIDEFVSECDERLKKGDMMAALHKLSSLLLREGHGGNYNHKMADMERFGLQQEDLDEVVKGVVDSAGPVLE